MKVLETGHCQYGFVSAFFYMPFVHFFAQINKCSTNKKDCTQPTCLLDVSVKVLK
jgi:hypothetical protein